MNKVLSLLAAGVVAASAVAVAVAPVAAAAPVTPAGITPARYVAMTPTRVLDTRTDGGPLGEGATRSLDLTQAVPTTATAVVLNLTATDPTAPGYLTVYPGSSPRPTASSLNKKAGETRSNSVTVALPNNDLHTLDIFNQAGSTQVVVDLLGYYDLNTGTSWYGYVSPERAYDSRDGGPDGGVFAPGDTITINGAADLSEVSAVALNITAVGPDGPGYLTAWSGEGDQPFVSSVNYSTGRTTPNFAVVPVIQNPDGGLSFNIGNNVSDTDIVVDVVGLYAASGQRSFSSSYVPVTPQRLSDTRQTGVLGPNQTYDTGVPDGAGFDSANLNITAVEPTASTYVTVYASDVDKPEASNLNPEPGDVVPNAVQTVLSSAGTYRVYNLSGFVNIVADLEGYFVADSTAPAASPHALAAPTFTSVRHSR